MENIIDYSKLLQFFRNQPPALPGEPDYNAEFCRILVEASSAEEASIWQLDSKHRLHPIYGTNFTPEEVKGVILQEGEGIGGAVVMSRRTKAVSQVLGNSRHNGRIDRRIGFRTRSMISAPIMFSDKLYGVVNVLNHKLSQKLLSGLREMVSTAAVMYAAALTAAGRLSPYQEPLIENDDKAIQSPKYKTVIVGASFPIQDVLQLSVRAARSDVPVLIRGETGTGKELVALRIHEGGNRASGPFIAVNCSAISETLLESELFGHVKGAFSGATDSRQGKFASASGGTLFLDEIGDMSPSFQANILRVLQEKKLSPVGSEKTITCDARIVAATNQDLRKKVDEGSFREDLFYRLCGIEILMPALRERGEDIPLLIDYFLNREAAEQKNRNPLYQLPKISNKALELLMAFRWSGNVRQLEQAVLAALAICESDQIQPNDFPVWFQNALNTGIKKSILKEEKRSHHYIELASDSDDVVYSNRERWRYLKALDSTKYSGTGRWNMSAAARRLGVPRKTFVYRLKRMRLIK
jgi:Nif-specific regulatory protein